MPRKERVCQAEDYDYRNTKTTSTTTTTTKNKAARARKIEQKKTVSHASCLLERPTPFSEVGVEVVQVALPYLLADTRLFPACRLHPRRDHAPLVPALGHQLKGEGTNERNGERGRGWARGKRERGGENDGEGRRAREREGPPVHEKRRD